MTNGTGYYQAKVWWMGYNVSRNPIGEVRNAPLESTPGN